MTTVVGTYPYNIQNGQIEDAVPVMGNFNWVKDQVNANVSSLLPANQSSIPTFVPSSAVGGTANAITLAPVPAITAYAEGQQFVFHAASFNTGATTIATSGLAPRSLLQTNGGNLTGSEIQAGGCYLIADNGTAYELLNGTQSSGVIAWTPVLQFGGASVGITYSQQFGRYAKYGNLVFFSFEIDLTSKGSSTGNATIAGLPFAVASNAVGNGSTGFFSNLTFSGQVVGVPVVSSNTIEFVQSSSGSAAVILTDSAFSNTTTLDIGGFYTS